MDFPFSWLINQTEFSGKADTQRHEKRGQHRCDEKSPGIKALRKLHEPSSSTVFRPADTGASIVHKLRPPFGSHRIAHARTLCLLLRVVGVDLDYRPIGPKLCQSLQGRQAALKIRSCHPNKLPQRHRNRMRSLAFLPRALAAKPAASL